MWGAAPVSILLSPFKRLLKLLTGVSRSQKVSGSITLLSCLLGSVPWGGISHPLLREPSFSE